MTSKWKRPKPPKITKDWVELNCRWLTPRDKHLVELISKYRMTTSKQLIDLHPDYRNLADPVHAINRRLRKLWLHYIVERAWFPVTYNKGSSPAVYALDKAGATLLSTNLVREFNYDEDGFPVLPPQVLHRLGVNDIACELAKTDMLSGWVSDFKALHMKADAFVDFPLFIEYDRGTMDRGSRTKFKNIQNKFEGYIKLYKLGWRYNGVFPRVIFVTTDINRVEPLRRLVLPYPIEILVIFKDNLPTLLSRLSKTTVK